MYCGLCYVIVVRFCRYVDRVISIKYFFIFIGTFLTLNIIYLIVELMIFFLLDYILEKNTFTISSLKILFIV